MSSIEEDTKSEQLHQLFVDQLKEKGFIQSPQVEAAFRAVPRHLFVPNVSADEAYRDVPIGTIKKDGRVVSSSTAPGLMAQMLEQLDLKPGHKVLEIGAGTGFNASLMAHIVGSERQIVAIDLDPEITEGAIEHVKQAGFENRVKIICRNGALGDEENAPYDRIILTVELADIAPAWFDQLKDGGLLEIPLELTQLDSVLEYAPTIVFEKKGDQLESKHLRRSGFMRFRGPNEVKTQDLHQILGIPNLSVITPVNIDTNTIAEALNKESIDLPTDLTLTYPELYGLNLWFALRMPNYCNTYATEDSMKLARYFTRDSRSYSSIGLCSKDSLSVLTVQEELKSKEGSTQVIVKTYGDDQSLADQVKVQMMEWDKAGRPFAFDQDWQMQGVKIEAFPKDSQVEPKSNSVVLEKQFSKLLISWGE